jgi:hypothetical protein
MFILLFPVLFFAESIITLTGKEATLRDGSGRITEIDWRCQADFADAVLQEFLPAWPNIQLRGAR